MATASMAFCRFGPRTAASAIASTSAGKLRATSTMRIPRASHQPPRKPSHRPMRLPVMPASRTTPKAITIVWPPPVSVRERRSRLSSSVPSGCSEDGGERRGATSTAVGLYGDSSGAASSTATTTPNTTVPRSAPGVRKNLRIADPRIQETVGEVDSQGHEGEAEADDERETEDRRVVEVEDRIHCVLAHAGPAENRFRDHRAAVEFPEGEADYRHQGSRRAFQGVLVVDAVFFQALRAGRADVIFPQHLEHAGAGHAGDECQLDVTEGDRGQDQVPERGEEFLPLAAQQSIQDIQARQRFGRAEKRIEPALGGQPFQL